MTLNLSTDYLIFDNAQAVTWTQASTGTEISVASALRREIKNTERQPSNGTYRHGDVWWEVPVTLLTTEPGPGDTLTDASSNEWTVLQVDVSTLASRYRCHCRNMRIAHNLRQLLQVWYGETCKDETGAAVRNWQPGERFYGRIQPAETTNTEEHGQRAQMTGYDVYCAEQLDMSREMLVETEDGTQYKVTSSRNAEQIGELMVLEVERTAWPSN